MVHGVVEVRHDIKREVGEGRWEVVYSLLEVHAKRDVLDGGGKSVH